MHEVLSRISKHVSFVFFLTIVSPKGKRLFSSLDLFDNNNAIDEILFQHSNVIYHFSKIIKLEFLVFWNAIMDGMSELKKKDLNRQETNS